MIFAETQAVGFFKQALRRTPDVDRNTPYQHRFEVSCQINISCGEKYKLDTRNFPNKICDCSQDQCESLAKKCDGVRAKPFFYAELRGPGFGDIRSKNAELDNAEKQKVFAKTCEEWRAKVEDSHLLAECEKPKMYEEFLPIENVCTKLTPSPSSTMRVHPTAR